MSSLSLRLIHNITLPFQDGVGLGLEESVPDDGYGYLFLLEQQQDRTTILVKFVIVNTIKSSNTKNE